MVRSPAASASASASPSSASRKRRIQSSSSSEELEEVHVPSPRKSKLRKMSLASPESSIEVDEDTEQPSQLEASNDQEAAATRQGSNEEEGESEEDAEWQEKYKVWEMFADEYHDIVEQLPLELQRSFQLMLEHDEQMRAHQRALENATIEYFSLAKSDAYQDAMIKEQLARKMAAHLGAPAATPQPVLDGAAHDAPVAVIDMSSSSSAPLDNTINGGGENATATTIGGDERASNSTEEDMHRNIIRSASPQKAQETLQIVPSITSQEDAASEPDTGHLRKLLGDIVTHSRAAIKAGDDKVALAVTAYNWVDRHLNRLDTDLMKHEEALSLGLRAGTQPSTDAREAQGYAEDNTNLANMQNPNGTAGGGKGSLPRDTHARGGKKNNSKTSRGGKSNSVSLPPAGEEEEPVFTGSDADTELWCYCRNVSSGVMVACDNEDCPNGWYHLACLGMEQAPEGSWFCPECEPRIGGKSAPKKKKKKSSRRY